MMVRVILVAYESYGQNRAFELAVKLHDTFMNACRHTEKIHDYSVLASV